MAVTAQWLFYNYIMIENYTFLRNESQFLKFFYFRQVVVSAKCLFGAKSARHTVRPTNVRSTKCPSAKCPFGKMSFGKVSFGKMSGYRKHDAGRAECFHTISSFSNFHDSRVLIYSCISIRKKCFIFLS